MPTDRELWLNQELTKLDTAVAQLLLQLQGARESLDWRDEELITALKERDAALERIVGLEVVLKASGEHIEELREAWVRGVITEHDHQGGTRSNRNADLDRQIRIAIKEQP